MTAVLIKLDAAASRAAEALAEGGDGAKLGACWIICSKIADDIAQSKGTVGKLIGSDEMYDKAMGIADDLKDASGRMRSSSSDNEGRWIASSSASMRPCPRRGKLSRPSTGRRAGRNRQGHPARSAQ